MCYQSAKIRNFRVVSEKDANFGSAFTVCLMQFPSPQPFLKVIAAAYHARYGARLADFMFVFPNKRGAAFFVNNLRSCLLDGEVLMAPRTATISDLVAELSGLDVDSRIDLLFTLFAEYRGLLMERGADPASISFDSFRGWGEVALGDFGDVDMYDADPDRLFTNVADYKNLASDYLTDDQREVLRDYFGTEVSSRRETDTFWKHFTYKSTRLEDKEDLEETERIDVRSSFGTLWQVMAPLYHRMRSSLRSRGLAYQGMATREAADRLAYEASIPGVEKIVFVGFNVLTGAERRIFKELAIRRSGLPGSSEPYADFVWDLTGVPLADRANPAVRMMLSNIKVFPKPEWLDLEPCASSGVPPVIKVISSPSASMQARIAASITAEVAARIGAESVKAAKTAIVLPDEGLLFPLLYSMPQGIGDVNLTMGYPLRLTSTISLVGILRRMQGRKHCKDGDWAYFHEDVKLLAAHPFVQLVAGGEAIGRLRSFIYSERRFVVAYSDLVRLLPKAAPLLHPFAEEKGFDAVGRLDDIVRVCAEAVAAAPEGSALVKKRLDLVHLQAYRDALRRLADASARHDVELSWRDVFQLADRLIAVERVPFEGQPLKGIQVMGMLETRSLDFEYLVIPSMNERIFPRRMRKKTLIPASLRRAFGLPPAAFQESIFSYYFYRLIARAKELYLIYDARTSDLNSAEPSRFIFQLRHLYAPVLQDMKGQFRLSAPVRSEPRPAAHFEVESLLRPFLDEKSNRNLSYSSLWDYAQCPLRFCLRHLYGIADDREPAEFMDAPTQGKAAHRVLEELYMPDPSKRRKLHLDNPVIFTSRQLRDMAADTDGLMLRLRRAINIEYHHLPPEEIDVPLAGDSLMTAHVLASQIAGILRHDATIAPLKIYGVEIKDVFHMPVGDTGAVNFTFSFDRLDQPAGSPIMRVVDYKTGRLHTHAESLDAVFDGDFRAKDVSQLLTYASFYSYITEGRLLSPVPMSMVIYSLGHAKIGSPEQKVIYGAGKDALEMPDNSQVKEDFAHRLQNRVEEIFSPATSFSPTSDKGRCKYCAYRVFCS